MKLVRYVFAAGFVAVAIAAVACSERAAPIGSNGPNGTGNVGTVGGNTGGSTGNVNASLVIVGGSGQELQSIDWMISGGPGGTYTGTDPIGNAQGVQWTAGGIVAGCGYSLSVSGTDTTGDFCSGASTPFCVTTDPTGASSGITYVAIVITCTVPTDAATPVVSTMGSIFVDAQVTLAQQAPFSCPGISAFSISPAEVAGSQPAALGISMIDGPATISWTATPCAGTGTFVGFVGPDGGPDTTDPDVEFNCGSCVGAVTVTAQVEELQKVRGQQVNVCNGVNFTTMSGNIVCEGGGSADSGASNDL